MSRIRRLALLALAALLFACNPPLGVVDESHDAFAAALRRAKEARTSEVLSDVAERFEHLGQATLGADTAALAELARLVEEDAPIEATRLRLLVAGKPGAQGELAMETARALLDIGLVHAANALAESASTTNHPSAEVVPDLVGHLAARDAMAGHLKLKASTPSAKRLLDVLTQSPYADPDGSFWQATEQVQVGENDEPAHVCHIAQFERPQLLGRELETSKRYRNRSQVIDVVKRPWLMAQTPETAEFNVLGLAVLAQLPSKTPCRGDTDVPRSLGLILARAGLRGPIIQQLCIGTTAAAVVHGKLMDRVVLVVPAFRGVDVLISSEQEKVYLRRLQGPEGRSVMLVGMIEGALSSLTTAIVDPIQRAQLLAAKSMQFGNVNVLKLRQIQSDSLMLNFSLGLGREDCRQCPHYRKVVHIESVDGGYRVAGEICSAQEVPSATNGFISAGAMASVLSGEDGLGLGIVNFKRFVDRELKAGKSPQEFVPRMMDNYIESTDNLQRAGDFLGLERRALDLEAAMVAVPKLEPALLDSAVRAAGLLTQIDAAYFLGDLDRAVEIGERAIRLSIVTSSPRVHLDFANRLSVIYLVQENYRAAFPYLELAQTLESGQSAAPGNLAWYSIQASDYRNAERFAMLAMNAALRNKGRIGINAVFMAKARAGSVGVKEALDWLVFAANAASADGNYPDRAAALMSAASMAHDLDEPRLGLALLEQAMVYMDETSWRTEGPAYLILQARLLLRLGDNAEARSLAQLAVDLSRGRPTTARVSALVVLSRLAADDGNSSQALALAKDGFTASVTLTTSWQGEGYQLASAESAREAAEWYLALLSRDHQASMDTLFDELSVWKAHVLRNGLAQRHSNTQVSATQFSSVAAASGLSADEAYVDFFIGRQSSFAMVLYGGRAWLVTLPQQADSVRSLVLTVRAEMDVTQEASRDYIARFRMSPPLTGALRQLHASLIAPLRLPPTVKHLNIAPDSSVGSVPWSALIDSAGRYVGERVAVLVVPGSYFLSPGASCSEKSCADRTLVAGIGRSASISATADDGSTVTLPSLLYGRKELQELASIWGDRWIELSDREGRTPGRQQVAAKVVPWLSQNSARMKTLHVVGHGSFSHTDQIKSRLYIEPSGTPAFVTADQLSKIDFAGLPLVTVGACESGALHSQGGGEPLGVVRAFISAGAQRVVASQWLVDDRATLLLMTRLHERLRQNASDMSAFFDAQRETARRYPHPYFWAAFQMYGRPER